MADRGHNSLGGNSADQLRAYVSRVERLEDEIAGLNGDKSGVYSEAKACGFDVRTLKKLIARRRKDTSELQEEDALLEAYEVVLASMPEEVDPLE